MAARPGHRWILDWTWQGQEASWKIPKEEASSATLHQQCTALGSLPYFARSYYSLGCGLQWAIGLLRYITKKTNVTNKSSWLNKNKTTNSNIYCWLAALPFWPLWLSTDIIFKQTILFLIATCQLGLCASVSQHSTDATLLKAVL
jgi:hypothetical protein